MPVVVMSLVFVVRAERRVGDVAWRLSELSGLLFWGQRAFDTLDRSQVRDLNLEPDGKDGHEGPINQLEFGSGWVPRTAGEDQAADEATDPSDAAIFRTSATSNPVHERLP